MRTGLGLLAVSAGFLAGTPWPAQCQAENRVPFEALYRQAHELRLRQLGPEHPDTIESLVRLGVLLRTHGRAQDAETLLREALDARSRSGVAVEEILLEVAETLAALGRDAEAEDFYSRSLERAESDTGSARTLLRIAALREARGDAAGARQAYLGALEHFEKGGRVADDERKARATALNDLGLLLEAEGELNDAETIYRRSADAHAEAFGKEHPSTAVARANLAGILAMRGEADAATALLERSLTILGAAYGPRHDETARLHNRLGEIYEAQDRLEEAKAEYLAALKAWDEPSASRGLALADLGRLAGVQGNLAAAETTLREAVGLLQSAQPRLAVELAEAFDSYGSVLRTLGSLDEAERVLRKALALREGQLGASHSDSFNRNGGLRAIFDPLTTDPDGNNRTQFANNNIPASRLDETSQRVLAKTWAPNNDGDNASGANNFRLTFPITYAYWNLTNRTDYNVSDSVKIFGRFSRFHTTQSEPDYSGSVAQRRQGSARNSAQASGDVVWTISPTTVFNMRGSWSKITDSFYTPDSQIGAEGLAELWPSNNWYASHVRDIPAVHFPEIRVDADSTTSFGRSGFWFQEPSTWNLEAKISRQMGRHYVKFGGQYRKQLVLAARPRGMRFRFNANPTADTANSPNTGELGHAWASMALGLMQDSNWSRARTVAVNRPRVDVFGFFVHDDFKLNSRVTLNLGLRYEYETPMRDPENRLSRYLDLGQALPEVASGMGAIPGEILAMRTSPLDISGAWLFTDGNNRNAWNAQTNLFLPRAGIAIRLNSSTALRIGYSRYATPPIQEKGGGASDAGLDILGSTPYPGYEIEGSPLQSINGTPRAYFADPFPSGGEHPNPLPEPFGQRFGRFATVGTNEARFFHQDWSAGINDRFNISLQREIVSRIVIDATYFANFGSNQPYDRRHNLLDPRIGYQFGSAINASTPNPFYGLPQEIMPGPLANRRSVRVRDLLTPYPHFLAGGINEYVFPGRRERYNSLQLQLQRPFEDGFNFIVGYNYHRARNEDFYDGVDEIDQRFSFQDDVRGRHKFTMAGIYELPIGRNKPLGTNVSGALSKIVSGWQVSGLYTYIGGELLRFGGLQVSGDPVISNPTRERMFDTAAFSNLPAFTRRSNPWSYSGVHGPRFSNLDIVFAKRTRISENLLFEFRMESYNLTNSFMGSNPSTNVNSGNFGRISSKLRTHFGREWQYSGRFIW